MPISYLIARRVHGIHQRWNGITALPCMESDGVGMEVEAKMESDGVGMKVEAKEGSFRAFFSFVSRV